jgi:glucose-1-phosphate cytidylyltransferase
VKVVLFCGGLGLRFRGAGINTPKPLGQIGDRPIIDHLMSYYAAHGHNDFVLCVGYGASAIRRYFLRGITEGEISEGEEAELANLDELVDLKTGWKIRFVDSGIHSSIGMRLLAAKSEVEGDVFLANYSDALSDLPLNDYVTSSLNGGAIANFVSVRPNLVFHEVIARPDGYVESFESMTVSNLRINGGFFLFRPEFFDYLKDDEDLVEEPFERLIGQNQLRSYNYDGFWQCMDTFKDKQLLENLQALGDPPWEFWKRPVAQLSGHAS